MIILFYTMVAFAITTLLYLVGTEMVGGKEAFDRIDCMLYEDALDSEEDFVEKLALDKFYSTMRWAQYEEANY